LHSNIGSDQFLFIDIEDLSTPTQDDWLSVENYPLDTTNAIKVTVSNVQDYLDDDGYVSLRARWVGFVSSNELEIYEIWRTDPIILGPKTILGHVPNSENSVDGDLDSFATIYYHWGEADRYDFLHVLSYVGDASNFTFSIKTGSSPQSPDSELIIEGENEPDNWDILERISLDITRTTLIELMNSRPYINADGFLSLRIRWENSTPQFDYDINIYEIWK
jgi:hypothetical protein